MRRAPLAGGAGPDLSEDDEAHRALIWINEPAKLASKFFAGLPMYQRCFALPESAQAHQQIAQFRPGNSP
jgi:hypothetical protein